MTGMAPTFGHSAQCVGPMAAEVKMEEVEFRAPRDGLHFVWTAAEISSSPKPSGAIQSKIPLDLDTIQPRDFGGTGGRVSVVAMAPALRLAELRP